MTPEEYAVRVAGDFNSRDVIDHRRLIAAAIREAVAAEREACAKIAADFAGGESNDGDDIAERIRAHQIPVGALVEIADSGARLFVAAHHRDCDGTPLYALMVELPADESELHIREFWANKVHHGYSKESLIVVKLPNQ